MEILCAFIVISIVCNVVEPLRIFSLFTAYLTLKIKIDGLEKEKKLLPPNYECISIIEILTHEIRDSSSFSFHSHFSSQFIMEKVTEYQMFSFLPFFLFCFKLKNGNAFQAIHKKKLPPLRYNFHFIQQHLPHSNVKE